MASPENDVASLNRLYEDYWEFILKENPTFATYLGDHRYDNWLEDVSSEAYQQRIDRFRKFLSDIKGFKKPTNGEDRLNYDLFKRELALQIEGAKYQPYLLPITQQTGPHIDLPQLITYHPFKTLQDYVNYISRLTQFRRVFDQTITSLKTSQIHSLGKRELARIGKEIDVILRKVQFKGSLQQYNDTLRKDKSNFYTTGQELLDGFKQILRQMDARLAEFFGQLPQAKYDFREIEEWRADAAPAAYYYAPPEDRSRPGYFYVNTYKPETRPKYMMEALAYHEAVPGNHLQIAIQQELTNLPKFRRHGGYTAFVEGWALYAEWLSKEMGFYKDLLAEYGRLTAEAWRASRLVVDTGIHSLKWTRAQAIKFLKNNTASSEQDIVSEVDRYIAWPGQALAYKMG